MRARAYLTTPATEKGAEIDPDLRRLQFKKNNYDPVGQRSPAAQGGDLPAQELASTSFSRSCVENIRYRLSADFLFAGVPR